MVVFMQISCFSGAIALGWATFGEGNGPIYLDSVLCMGHETRLIDCQHRNVDVASRYCFHYKDAGVVCSGEYTNTCAHTKPLKVTDGTFYNLSKMTEILSHIHTETVSTLVVTRVYIVALDLGASY